MSRRSSIQEIQVLQSQYELLMPFAGVTFDQAYGSDYWGPAKADLLNRAHAYLASMNTRSACYQTLSPAAMIPPIKEAIQVLTVLKRSIRQQYEAAKVSFLKTLPPANIMNQYIIQRAELEQTSIVQFQAKIKGMKAKVAALSRDQLRQSHIATLTELKQQYFLVTKFNAIKVSPHPAHEALLNYVHELLAGRDTAWCDFSERGLNNAIEDVKTALSRLQALSRYRRCPSASSSRSASRRGSALFGSFLEDHAEALDEDSDEDSDENVVLFRV